MDDAPRTRAVRRAIASKAPRRVIRHRVYIDRIETDGLAALGDATLDLARVERFTGSAARMAALGDALLVPFAAVDLQAFRALLEGWGVEAEVDTDGGHSAHWAAAPWMRTLTIPEREGRVRVSARLVLDPPLFGHLKDLATRDARLVDALGAGATVTLVSGLRFSPDADAVAAELLGVRVGDESFAVSGPDRPAWLDGLIRKLRRRVLRGPAPMTRWAEMAGSWIEADQAALRRALAGVRDAPFRLPELVPLAGGPALLTEAGLQPVSRMGGAARRAVGEAAAAWLGGADTWIVPEPAAAHAAWYPQLVEGENSPLEQVILLGAPID